MSLKRLPRSFYLRDVHLVAKDLLNKVIVAGSCSARIVEVEAYAGDLDPASHSYRGETPRNSVMFVRGGLLYVYFTYGMHFCMNAVVGPVGEAHAVLIRAAEPLSGISIMRRRRGLKISDRDLCRGPARLTQALGIARKDNGLDLTSKTSRVGIFEDGVITKHLKSKRIGISSGTENEWRYFVDSPFVSATR
jgi:DNA-3-methyladenine glycosylase